MSNVSAPPPENTQRAAAFLDTGISLEENGKTDEALQCYEAAIGLSPDLARAHFNIGNIFLDRGEPERAIASYQQVLRFKPDSAGTLANIGAAHLRLGNAIAAIASCRQALVLKSELFDAHVTIGAAYAKLGKPTDAIVGFRQALRIKPNSAEVLCNLAMAQLDCNQAENAINNLDTALTFAPNSWEVHQHRGMVCQVAGKFEIAIESYKRALEINPALPDAHYNLGLTLQRSAQLDFAVESYQRAIVLNPEFVLAHNNLGVVLGQLGCYAEALACFQAAIDIQPDYVDGHRNMGINLVVYGQPMAGIVSFKRAIDLCPTDTDSYIGLGNAFKDAGDIDAAIASFRHALELDPDNFLAHSNLLLTLSYSEHYSVKEAFGAAVHFGEIAARIARPYLTWPNILDPQKKLRIGLVSGDLREHPVGYFLENVLSSLMLRGVDLHAYATVPNQDQLSNRIQKCCARWRNVDGLSDEDLAKLIREDGIDILIDLAGHTAHNRTAMFAWKAAPIQASWLGYCCTTGLTEIDYYIADTNSLTPSLVDHFVESIWQLPESYLCLSPPTSNLPSSSPPALARGAITFGSFNNLPKLSDETIALWARVLEAVPSSQLLLKTRQLDDEGVRQLTLARFAKHGIRPHRLVLEGHTKERDGHLIAYNRVDIALDPSPYNGVTTTLEALWMGVPVLSLSGSRFLSRQGVSLLTNAGLHDWIAIDPDDYVARAVSHASKLPELAELRSRLRIQVAASPLFDATRFAIHFEGALRGMWQAWCRSQQVQLGSPT